MLHRQNGLHAECRIFAYKEQDSIYEGDEKKNKDVVYGNHGMGNVLCQ